MTGRTAGILGLLVGCILTPIAYAIAAGPAEGGHGSYAAAKLLFPFSMTSAYIFGVITLPFAAIGAVQYPL